MADRDDDLVAGLRDFVAEHDDTLERLDALFRVLRDDESTETARLDTDAMWSRVVERWESIEPA
ncbi:MAG TPA: hypothetical protein VGN51_22245 [Acidimicrobiia bacterium]